MAEREAVRAAKKAEKAARKAMEEKARKAKKEEEQKAMEAVKKAKGKGRAKWDAEDIEKGGSRKKKVAGKKFGSENVCGCCRNLGQECLIR